MAETPAANGGGASVAKADTNARYFCPKCDAHFRAVEDAVTGAPAKPTII